MNINTCWRRHWRLSTVLEKKKQQKIPRKKKLKTIRVMVKKNLGFEERIIYILRLVGGNVFFSEGSMLCHVIFIPQNFPFYGII